MRVNVKRVLEALLSGRSLNLKSISAGADSKTVYSYFTALLYRPSAYTYILNLTKYSRTTSAQQTALHGWLHQRGAHFHVVTGIRQGAHGIELLDAAKLQHPEAFK